VRGRSFFIFCLVLSLQLASVFTQFLTKLRRTSYSRRSVEHLQLCIRELEPSLVFMSLTKTRTAENVRRRLSFVGIISTVEIRSSWRETHPPPPPSSTNLCSTDPTMTVLGLSPSFRGEMLTTDLDSQGTAQCLVLRMFLVSATPDNTRNSEHRS
jgi:hypothetical protein